jgi:hypothetical protein
MKKVILIIFIFIFIVNLDKSERVIHLPFNIPGKQMAATIPPFGIFIEKGHINDPDEIGSILRHERVHWNIQYREMGLFKFYYCYLIEYIKHGRIDNWMENEARSLSNVKNK